MERTTYDVSPDGPNRWTINKRGQGPVDSFERKREAVSSARKLAKAQKPSQVVVHKRDGSIGFEFTYGDDPFPSEG